MGAPDVVVTGLGAVTPLGLSAGATWQGLVEGRSGVARITLFDPSDLPVQIAAEVKGFDPAPYVDPKMVGRLERFTQFAVAASVQALADAGITPDGDAADRIGVVMNTGGGGMPLVERERLVLLEKGPRRVSPFFVPMMMPNIGACQVSIQLGLRGPAVTATAACASGVQAILDGLRLIRDGDADVIIAGGSESALTPLSIAAMANMRALSRRNDEPERASRPFDVDRDGFVFGEGAVALVLERRDHALARGARIYAAVLGGAMTADAYHITAPDPQGDGARRVMELAMRKAGIAPDEVDYINAHGTSTPANDRLETLAIKRAFGDHAYRLAVSSTKSMTGHLLGAAGAIEAIATVLAIQHQTAPPTINYQVPDPECDLDYVPNEARPMRIDIALSNSFGFGGHNATLVFKRWQA